MQAWLIRPQVFENHFDLSKLKSVSSTCLPHASPLDQRLSAPAWGRQVPIFYFFFFYYSTLYLFSYLFCFRWKKYRLRLFLLYFSLVQSLLRCLEYCLRLFFLCFSLLLSLLRCLKYRLRLFFCFSDASYFILDEKNYSSDYYFFYLDDFYCSSDSLSNPLDWYNYPDAAHHEPWDEFDGMYVFIANGFPWKYSRAEAQNKGNDAWKVCGLHVVG